MMYFLVERLCGHVSQLALLYKKGAAPFISTPHPLFTCFPKD